MWSFNGLLYIFAVVMTKSGLTQDTTLDLFMTTPTICPTGKEFCLLSGQCEDSCHRDSGSNGIICGDDQIFCLATRTCVSIEHGCYDNKGPYIQCGEDEIFCLSSRTCVNFDVPCSGSMQNTYQCGDDEMFCLAERRCVHVDQDCSDNYPETHHHSHHCGENEMFCLSERRCVHVDQDCSYNYPETHDHSHHCGENEMFCLSERRCVHVDQDCSDIYPETHDHSHQCGDDEMFCLAERRCVHVDQDCSYNYPGTHDHSYHCGDDEMFCLAERRCVHVDQDCNYRYPGTHDQSYHCGENEIFCLAERRCVHVDQDCSDNYPGTYHHSYYCKDNEMFCLAERRCVHVDQDCSDNYPGTPYLSYNCGDDEMFCLAERRCVHVDQACIYNYPGTHDLSYNCGDDEIFCLAERRCVHVDQDCSHNYPGTHDHSHHCGDDEMFCLAERRCVHVDQDCIYNYPGTPDLSYNCGDDEIFCLAERRCVYADQDCSDNYPGTYHHSYYCGDDEMFCLAERRCVHVDQDCSDNYPETHHHSHHCGENEMFCLSERRCVHVDQDCSYNYPETHDHSHHCGENEMFCLSERRCVHVDQDCSDIYPETHDHSHQCGDDEMFCLAERRCVHVDQDCSYNYPGTHDHSYHCGDDEMFCLAERRCVHVDQDCNYRYPGTHDQSYHCGENEIFCLAERRCVQLDQDCSDNYPGTYHHSYYCKDNEMFCLAERRCVHVDQDCSDNYPGTPYLSYNCGDDEMFCLAERRCVHVDQACIYNYPGTHDLSYNCGDDEIFCLAERRCVHVDQDCSHNYPGTPDLSYHCGDDEIFCLAERRCVYADQDCSYNYPGTHDHSHHCGDDEMFCLAERRCVHVDQDCIYNYPGTPDLSYNCGDDEIFCLAERRCVYADQDCSDNYPGTYHHSYYCGDDEMFCLAERRCVHVDQDCSDDYPGTHDHSYHCGDDKMFCLAERRCVHVDQDCSDNYPGTPDLSYHCGGDKMFCLAERRCVHVDQDCSYSYPGTHDHSYHCGDDEMFCLAERRCVHVDQDCSDNYPGTHDHSYHCGDDEMFCLAERRCVHVDQDCSDNYPGTPDFSYHCGDDEMFCLAERRCVHVDQDCSYKYPGTTDLSYRCGDDEMFCLAERRCVHVDQDCSYNYPGTPDLSSNCGDDEMFCLAERRCVHVDQDCSYNYPGTPDLSYNCGDDEMFCLAERRCVHMDQDCSNSYPGTIDHSYNCGDDEIFCLAERRCIYVDQDCDYNDPGTHDYSYHCGDDEMFCLAERRCVHVDQDCDDSDPGTHDDTYQCGDDEMFCLSTKECVTTDCAQSRLLECPSNQVYCHTTGTCSDTGCDDFTHMTNTMDPSYATGMTEISHMTDYMGTEPTTEKMQTKHTTVTVTYTFAGNRVLLLEEAVSVGDASVFSLGDIDSGVLGQVDSVRVDCDSVTQGGIHLYKGGMMLDKSHVIHRDDKLTWTTQGIADGLITCMLLDVPTHIAMGYKYHIGVLAVPTSLPPPFFTMKYNRTTITEGTKFLTLDDPRDIFDVHYQDHVPVIDSSLEIITNKSYAMNNYKMKVHFMQQNMPIVGHLAFHQMPLDATGLPLAGIQTWSGSLQQWTRIPYTGLKIDMMQKSSDLRVAFKDSYSGELDIAFNLESGASTHDFNFKIEVLSVNDAPELISSDRLISTVEDTMVLPYDGNREFVVGKDITSRLLHDKDGDAELGLAVLGALSDRAGYWSYQDGENFTEITADSSLRSIVSQGMNVNMSAILLRPQHKLMFTPTVSYLWSQREAWAETRLLVLGWDMSNVDDTDTTSLIMDIEMMPCGFNMMCGPGRDSPFSTEIIPLFMGKAGCDGVPGSQMEEDNCGVCGGHDDCIDCNGDVKGNAVINICDHCVGGATGIALDHGTDCRKKCGEYTSINIPQIGLSMCLPASSDISSILSVYLSCDGQFISDAFINQCDHCVLGNTTLPADHGMNPCGSCHGDTWCMDCNGEPYGLSMVDNCNNCLLPTDPAFNTGCQKLGSVNPTIMGASGTRALRISGAQLNNYQSADCRLQDISDISRVIPMVIEPGDFQPDQNIITGRINNLMTAHVGVYHVFCIFDGNNATELELLDHDVTLFDYPVLEELYPHDMTLKEQPLVIVTGSGFISTNYISCALRCPYIDPAINCFTDKLVPSGLVHFPARRLNDSAVECNMMKMSHVRRAMGYQLTVLLERPAVMNMHSLTFKEFGVLAPAPQLLSAQFSSSYCLITLTFNMAVEGPKGHLFTPNTMAALGSGAKYTFTGNRLVIMVQRGNLQLRPGDNMTLLAEKIRPLNSHVNFTEFVAGSVTVQAPSYSFPLEGKLNGPNGGQVGSCDPFTFTLKLGKMGCAVLEYNWTVSVNHSSPSHAMLDDAKSIQDRLNMYNNRGRSFMVHENEVLPGSTYIFTFMFIRHMDSAYTELSVPVTRSVAVKPISVQLLMMSQSPDPRQPIRFLASLTTSNCSGINIQETTFLYNWKGNSADFSIMSFMQFAVVKGGSLRGGTTYTMSVTVFVQDDDSITDTASVTFTTISRPLQLLVPPLIQTLPYLSTTLIVSGVDPNNMPQSAIFTWNCAKESEPNLPVYVTVNNQRRMLEEYVRPASDTENSITIPENILPLGRYIWTIKMLKDTRSVTSSTVMEVVDNRAPRIDLSAIEVTLNSQDPLRIGCKVTTYSKSPVMLYWDCASEENCFDLYRYSDMLLYESDSSLSDYDFSLFLPGNLPTNGQLELAVTAVAGEESLTTTETVTVIINSPPMMGDVQITPQNGTAFDTMFMIEMDEGWIDPEGDTVLFYIYTHKVGTNTRKRLNARGLQDILSHDLMLPSGEFEIFLEACDESWACDITNTPLYVTVAAQVMTEAKMEETANNLADMLKVDMDSAVELAIPLAEMMEDSNTTEKLGEVVNEVAYNFLSSSSAEFDRDQASNILDTAVSILESAAKTGLLAPKVITEAQSKAFQLAALVLGVVDSGSGNRRKRAVEDDSSTKSPMTKAEAETILSTYAVTFSGQAESDVSKSDAEDYLTAVDNIRMGLCAEVVYGEGATVAESSMETVRVVKRTADTIATEVIDVTCQNCAVTQTAKIAYGTSIQSVYMHWNCTSTENCNGACFTSSQLNKDLVTSTSPQRFTMDLTRRSDIITVMMVNPSTHDIMTIDSLISPIVITVPISGNVNETEYSLQCKRWNVDVWTETGCESSAPYQGNDTYYVQCSCNMLGIFSVFEGPVIEATTPVAMTTGADMETVSMVTSDLDMTSDYSDTTEYTTIESSESSAATMETMSNLPVVNTTITSTTLATTTLASRVSVPKDTDKVYIMFKVHGVYDTVVENDKEAFLVHLRSDLAIYMRIAESRINNLKVTKGSIIINFELLSRTRNTELTLGEVVYILLQGVQTGSLPLTDLQGNSLVLDIHSFVWSTNQLEPPSETNSKMTVYIVGGAIGAFVLLVFLTGAFLYIFKVKAGKAHQVSHSPQPLYGPNMQGVDVPRSSGKQQAPVGNWVRNESEVAASSCSGTIKVQEKDVSDEYSDPPPRYSAVSPIGTDPERTASPPSTTGSPLPPIGV